MERKYYMFFNDGVVPANWEEDFRAMNKNKLYKKPETFEYIFKSVILYFPTWEAAKECLIHNQHRFHYLVDVRLNNKKIWVERVYIA